MIELSEIGKMMENMLNDNEYGIKFNIRSDRNEYISEMKNVGHFVVPGVITAMSGNYEPLQNIKVYTMPLTLELFGYVRVSGELPSVPFTTEEVKECVGNLVDGINGTTIEISKNAVIFAGATVTVGNITNNCGGGYTRIPILVQFRLTVVEKAMLFNNYKIKLDNEEIMFSDINFALVRQGESITTVGTTTAKTICSQMSHVFSGTAFMLNNDLFVQLQNEIFNGNEINKKHILTINDTDFSVIISEAAISGQMGSVMQMSITMAEAYDG
jgi:hypothetical protein